MEESLAQADSETSAGEPVAVALASIRATKDPAARARAARDLEARLLTALDEVRGLVGEAAALVHADHPETIDERQQAPWG